MTATQNDLINLKPDFPFLVGIDSDGCVFDSMGIKQKECFHPVIIQTWGLEKIEPVLRETAEFVNLYSKNRGQNRFIALHQVFCLLQQRPEAVEAGIPLPDPGPLGRFVESGQPLTNGTLEQMANESGDAELHKLYAWSLKTNATVEAKVKNLPPFDGVRRALELMKTTADLIVVSQTPTEALTREWNEHAIDGYVELIAGQELGTKAEHLALASDGKYDGANILMIGDAPGDLKAAESVGACFFPINPGKEEPSWQHLHEEAYTLFTEKNYRGSFQQQLINDFQALLPTAPPWPTLS